MPPVVVGIGAINLDHAVDVGPIDPADTREPPLIRKLRRRLTERGIEFQWDVELEVEPDIVRSTVADFTFVDTLPGGSALNAVAALARTGLEIPTGFVGVAGCFPGASFTPKAVFAGLGIEDRHVVFDETSPAGLCLAVVRATRRTLLTHAGANTAMASHLQRRREELVDYLAAARIIHVTSLLDPDSPGELLKLLRAVQRRNPHVIITFDPGHVWATQATPIIHDLTRLSTILFVNEAEFAGLGQRAEDDDDTTVAGRILTGRRGRRGCVLLKRPDGITTFWRERKEIRYATMPQNPLPPEQVMDSRGSGDVFAAGVLAALALEKPLAVGVALGMNLARHALRQLIRTRQFSDFPLITSTVLDLDALARSGTPPARNRSGDA